MIEATSYTKDWILNIRNQIGKRIDPKMIEKVIYALSLLEQLVAENLKPRFCIRKVWSDLMAVWLFR